jgi:hypothetical protein
MTPASVVFDSKAVTLTADGSQTFTATVTGGTGAFGNMVTWTA